MMKIVRERIITQVIPPGARLREMELATEFLVPRTRIRDVLAALEARGLVERIPNRGAVVVRLGIEELLHLYDLREVLEGLAARLATQRAARGTWDDLVDHFGEPMAQHVAMDDFDSFFDGYEAFRGRVLKEAANPVLTNSLETVRDRIYVAIRRTIILPGRASVGLSEHRSVLAAMQSGDAEEAEQLRRLNIRSAREHLKRYKEYVL